MGDGKKKLTLDGRGGTSGAVEDGTLPLNVEVTDQRVSYCVIESIVMVLMLLSQGEVRLDLHLGRHDFGC